MNKNIDEIKQKIEDKVKKYLPSDAIDAMIDEFYYEGKIRDLEAEQVAEQAGKEGFREGANFILSMWQESQQLRNVELEKNVKSINNNGCSVCEAGQESYTTFVAGSFKGTEYYQYDYRHTDGELFTTIAKTLEECRKQRDEWISKK